MVASRSMKPTCRPFVRHTIPCCRAKPGGVPAFLIIPCYGWIKRCAAIWPSCGKPRNVSLVGFNNLTDPVGLLKKKLPAASWNNAGDVADYFLSILYPAEGKAKYKNVNSAQPIPDKQS